MVFIVNPNNLVQLVQKAVPNTKPSRHKRLLYKRSELINRSILFLALSSTVCITLIIFFNNSYGTLPALGKFLSPHLGIWQNGLDISKIKTKQNIFTPQIPEQKVIIDTNGVAHIFGQDAQQTYFIQGYLCAHENLWQMEYSASIAEGQSAGIIGSKGLKRDRYMRRIGLYKMAEVMTKIIEKDPFTKTICQAYTNGVNAYIDQLTYAKYPLEHKIYSVKPQPWSIYKTALIFKLFTYDWSAEERDLFSTNFIKIFGEDGYKLAFPNTSSLDMPQFSPMVSGQLPLHMLRKNNKKEQINNRYYQNIPRIQAKQSYPKPNTPIYAHSFLFNNEHSADGKAILGFDLRGPLQDPNYFYELQISYQNNNVYGVSIPGIPGVLMGFNKSMAWSIQPTGIDIKDYLYTKFSSASKDFYTFNNKVRKTQKEIVIYPVKGNKKQIDTLVYTDMGVVFWDSKNTKNLDDNEGFVMRWKVNAPSEDLKGFLLLNRAENHIAYKKAIALIQSPIIYISYADINNNIGINLQGSLPVRKSENLGVFLSPGNNMEYTWDKIIAQQDLPEILNSSLHFNFCNSGLPFYQGEYPFIVQGNFPDVEGRKYYNILKKSYKLDISQAEKLLNNTHNSFAQEILPIMLNNLNIQNNQSSLQYLNTLQKWNYDFNDASTAPTLFILWLRNLIHTIWDDDIRLMNLYQKEYPPLTGLLNILQKNYLTNLFIDNRSTKKKIETLSDILEISWQKTIIEINTLTKKKLLTWGKFSKQKIPHLSSLRTLAQHSVSSDPIAFLNNNYNIYGKNIPSQGSLWKMLVHLNKPIRAWGGSSLNVNKPLNDNTPQKLHPLLFMHSANDQIPTKTTIFFQNKPG